MSGKARFYMALATAWGFVLLALAGTALLVGADLNSAEREQALAILRDRAAHIVVAALLLLVPLAIVLRVLFRRYVRAPRRLAEDARIMLTANPAHRAELRGSAETQRLAAAFNAFASRTRASSRNATGWRR
jgi:DNA polymerase-3 subunit epsilon